jgi:multidrug efflux system outer membrane protein
LEFQALLAAARGGRFPEVSYSFSGGRTKSSFVLPSVGRVGIFSTTYGHDLTISYQIDLFGRLARAQQAAWAEMMAAQADRETLLHTVVASVVRARVRIAILERQLALTRSNTESWSRTARVVDRRYKQGLTGSLELRLARENLSATQASEVELEALIEKDRHALHTLMGIRPGTGAALPESLPELPALEPVPLGLPVDLLDRRPDLRAAEMRLAAGTARIGVAMADLFPSLSLTASGGIRSDDLIGLTSSDGSVYSLIANLVAPLFSGGKRRAQVKAARARAEQATAAYAGIVLQALREVEDALVNEEAAWQRMGYLDVRLEEAQAAERLARQRYQRGVDRLLTLLETERRRRLAETELLLTQADTWNARIDLFLALGGDWEIEADDMDAGKHK